MTARLFQLGRLMDTERLSEWLSRCQVTTKIGRMRKPDSYIVLPTRDGRVYLRGLRSVAVLDYRKGTVTYSTKGTCASLLATGLTVPADPEFTYDCLRVCPSYGGETEISPGCFFQHSVEL